MVREGCGRAAGGDGGRPAMIYEFANRSVTYFAPDAPDFAEARGLKGNYLAAAQRILDEQGLRRNVRAISPELNVNTP